MRSHIVSLVMAAVTAAWVAGSHGAAPHGNLEFQSLLEGDLLFHGTIVSATQEMMKPEVFEPGSDRRGYYDIRIVVARIHEVFRGSYEGEELTFAVNAGSSTLTGTYDVGSEVVSTLISRPNVLNGMFLLHSRFVKVGNDWTNPDGPYLERFSLSEIRALTRPFLVDALARDSDVVVVGEILRLQQRTLTDPASPGYALCWEVTLQVDRALKGSAGAPSVRFLVWRGGTYLPSWSAPSRVFKLEKNGRYCAALAKGDGVWTLVGGSDGLFVVDAEDALYRSGVFGKQQRLRAKLADMEALVRTSSPGDD